MHNYNMNNYYNSIDNICANSPRLTEEIVLTPWNELNAQQVNYVQHQLKKTGMYAFLPNKDIIDRYTTKIVTSKPDMVNVK